MSNVYILAPRPGNQPKPVTRAVNASVFDELTDRLIMEQAAAGTLNPGIVAALLAAVRRPSQEVRR